LAGAGKPFETGQEPKPPRKSCGMPLELRERREAAGALDVAVARAVLIALLDHASQWVVSANSDGCGRTFHPRADHIGTRSRIEPHVIDLDSILVASNERDGERHVLTPHRVARQEYVGGPGDPVLRNGAADGLVAKPVGTARRNVVPESEDASA